MFLLLNWTRKTKTPKCFVYKGRKHLSPEEWNKDKDKRLKKMNKNFRRMNRQRIIYNLKKKSKVFSFLYNVAPMFLLICFWLLLLKFFGFFDYFNNLTDRIF